MRRLDKLATKEVLLLEPNLSHNRKFFDWPISLPSLVGIAFYVGDILEVFI